MITHELKLLSCNKPLIKVGLMLNQGFTEKKSTNTFISRSGVGVSALPPIPNPCLHNFSKSMPTPCVFVGQDVAIRMTRYG